ncbi:MAG: hypothetical protein AAGN35_02800 [Bacteroidota bacterium]
MEKERKSSNVGDKAVSSTENMPSMMPPTLQLQAGKEDENLGGGNLSKEITIKRNHIHLKGQDKYGHWWTELSHGESYGWWPKDSVGLKGTLLGVEGELNGQTTFGGTPTRDPHHGEAGEESFKIRIKNPNKDEDAVKKEMRSFAQSYSGEWRWTLGLGGQNCHSFQKEMLKNSGVEIEK